MTKTKLNALLATTAVLALAACGGSGTSNGSALNPTQDPLTRLLGDKDRALYGGVRGADGNLVRAAEADTFFGTVPTSADYTALATEGVRIIGNHFESDFTNIASMPTGSVQYNGVAAFRDDTNDFDFIASNPQLLASTTLVANFEQNTINGVITDGVDAFGNTTTGSVNITNGQITGNVFVANLSGSGTFLGKTGTVSGDVGAGFVGSSADAVFGVMTGNAAGDPFAGTFIAER